MAKYPQRKLKAVEQKAVQQGSKLFYLYFGFLTVIFPLVHYTKTLDIVMMPRLLALSLFNTLFSILFILWIRKHNEVLTVLRNKIFKLFILWFVVTLVSLGLSTNPVESIFDLIKVAYMPIMVFWTVALVITEPRGLEKMVRFITIAGLILGTVAFWQYFAEVFQSKERFFDEYGRQTPIIYKVRGLMAHKNLLSISLGLILPFAVYGSISQQKYWKLVSYISATAILLLLVLLQTRAVWVGLMVSAIVVITTIILLGNKLGVSNKWRIGLSVAVVVGAIGLASILFLSSRPSSNQYIRQLQSIVNPQSKQNIHRINIWRTTLDMIPEKPLFGYGPGNWKLHAPKFHNGRFSSIDEFNWQRPHNDFLWVIAEKGFVGFLIYISIVGLIIFNLVSVIRKSDEKTDKQFATVLIGGLSMYLAASFFDFPYERVFHNVYLWFIFAVALILSKKNTHVDIIDKPKSSLLTLLPVAISLFGLVYGVQCVQQEVHLNIARKGFNYLKQLSQQGGELSPEAARRHWLQVLDESQKAQKPLKNIDPQANPIYSYEGIAYLNLGDYKNAIYTLEKAHYQHPGNILVLNNLGAAYFKIEKYDTARRYLEESCKILQSQDGVTNLSAVYYKLEMYQQAYELILNFPEKERSSRMLQNLKALETILGK